MSKTQSIEATVMDSHIPVSKVEICTLLPDVSPGSVEAAPGKMVRDWRTRCIGQARLTRNVRV